MLADCREPSQAWTRGVSCDPEFAGDSIPRLSSRHDQPVQRCEALQWDLPAEHDSGILFSSVAKLHRGKMLRHRSKTISDVLPVELDLHAVGVDTSEGDVDVRMLRVEVCHGHPFQRCVEVGRHAAHYFPR